MAPRFSLRVLRHCLRQESGAALVLWALALPVVVGGLGLGVDIGTWYYAKRNLQNATDAAAIAAGYDVSGANPQQTTMWYTADHEMTRNGFGNGITLTVNYPPLSGSNAGNIRAVEVIAAQPQPRFFSKLFIGSDPNAQVRAVVNRQPSGSACVLALSGNAPQALRIQGSTTINLNNCSAASNSTDDEAIYLGGSSTLNAYSLYTSGNYANSGSATLTTTEPAATQASPLEDPFSDISVPSYSGCNQNNYNANGTATINPGVYCNGMSFGSHAVITMNPGVYIINRGTFDANAGARVTGNGVTIILTSSTGSNYATVNINGNAVVNLAAPTTGTYSGLLFYQDINAPLGGTNRFNGGATTTYTGAIYFPRQEVQFAGNNSSGGGACTRIVAYTVTFTGNSYLSNDCPSSVATVATQGLVQLVE